MLNEPRYTHTAFGLNFDTCIPFLFPAAAIDEADVVIRFARVPDFLSEATDRGVRFEIAQGRFLLKVDNVARFLVEGGKSISIERYPEARDEEILLFLMGSVMGALLHQRGILALHASAVAYNGGSILFAGRSGTGKSTLAGALRQQGYQVLADDVCALSLDSSGKPIVIPGFPQLKLWSDAASKLGEKTEFLRQTRPSLQKYFLLLQDEIADEPLPLQKIYLLKAHNIDEFELEPITGTDKINALVRNTYRIRILEGVGSKSNHFQQCAAICRHVPVQRVIRPRKGYRILELVEMLEKDFRS